MQVAECLSGYRKIGWQSGAVFIALSLLLVFHMLQWPVYLFLCALFMVLRLRPKPVFDKAAYEASAFAVLLSDSNAQCCYVNEKWSLLSGLSLQEALGDGWLLAIHPEDQLRVLEMYTATQHGVLPALEYRFLHTDGRVVWVASSLLPVSACANVACQELLTDLTELKKQQTERSALLVEQRQLKEELESILSSSNDPIAAVDMDFCFSVFNQSYANLFFILYGIKVARQDCLLQYKLSSEEDRSNLVAFWGRVLLGESFVIRCALHGDDKVPRIFDLSFSPQFNFSGEQIGAINVLHDVTLSAQTERALQTSEELFKAAIQSSVDAIYVLEAIKDVNLMLIDFEFSEVNQNGFDFLDLHSQSTPPAAQLKSALSRIMYAGLFDICSEVFLSGIKYQQEKECFSSGKDGCWFLFSVVAISNGVVLTVSDISQRKRSELALAAFSGLQQAILDSAGSAIIVTDLSNTIRLFNRAAEKMLGYQASELIAKETPALFHQAPVAKALIDEFESELGEKLPDDADVFSIQAKLYIQRDWIYQHRDGHVFPVELTMNVVRNQNDEITGYMGIANDISVRKLAEIKLQQNESHTLAILDSLHDCVLSVGADGLILAANPAALKIFSYDNLSGKSLSLLFPRLGKMNSQQDLAQEIFVCLGVDTQGVSEVIAINREGVEILMDMALAIVEVEDKHIYIITLHDLTQHKLDEQKMQETIEELEAVQASLSGSHEQLSQANQELSRLAHLDGLTGIANRRLFDQTLVQEWARAARSGECLALAMLDVDYFKRYNDHFGHQVGDECLKHVAATIASALHRPGDFVARYGGEEFVLILPGTDQTGAVQVVETVLEQVRHLSIAHQTSDVAKVVTLSAGIAVLLPLQGIDPYYLVQAADRALYQAKNQGRNCYFVAGANRLTE
ncbi:diguanylate cyclase domain-containing protein [Iodobacter ciconiae]|uniref:Diguanylate cyclase n=1 Tax=Iodobacter ciconiae TaxID=2496266 RepID=A0A3S8ZQT7_9NEIS|nr:diguanylate cyclase [Iodobacter ciconiae]AZN35838.1 diguanylate cyclase [Iodobacter ciconiae]